MLHYALCLSYNPNTEAVLFAYLSSSRATTTGRLLGPKVGNSIKCLCATISRIETRFHNLSITSPAPLPMSYAAATFKCCLFLVSLQVCPEEINSYLRIMSQLSHSKKMFMYLPLSVTKAITVCKIKHKENSSCSQRWA